MFPNNARLRATLAAAALAALAMLGLPLPALLQAPGLGRFAVQLIALALIGMKRKAAALGGDEPDEQQAAEPHEQQAAEPATRHKVAFTRLFGLQGIRQVDVGGVPARGLILGHSRCVGRVLMGGQSHGHIKLGCVVVSGLPATFSTRLCTRHRPRRRH